MKNGVYVVDAARSVSSALVSTVAETRDIMDYHRFLGHTHERYTSPTANVLDTVLTGTWEPCVGCSIAKAGRVAVPQHTSVRCTKKVGTLFIELSGPRSEQCLKRSLYLMTLVNAVTRMN